MKHRLRLMVLVWWLSCVNPLSATIIVDDVASPDAPSTAPDASAALSTIGGNTKDRVGPSTAHGADSGFTLHPSSDVNFRSLPRQLSSLPSDIAERLMSAGTGKFRMSTELGRVKLPLMGEVQFVPQVASRTSVSRDADFGFMDWRESDPAIRTRTPKGTETSVPFASFAGGKRVLSDSGMRFQILDKSRLPKSRTVTFEEIVLLVPEPSSIWLAFGAGIVLLVARWTGYIPGLRPKRNPARVHVSAGGVKVMVSVEPHSVK